MYISRLIVSSSRRPAAYLKRHTVRFMSSGRKAGVADPEELKTFIANAGGKLVVADVRNPDASVEPGDAKSIAVGQLPSAGIRPMAQLLTFDRETKSMPLPEGVSDKDTPIITHCGGGGRGQKAKDFLEAAGFTNVMNGAGPKDTELWELYGDK